MFFGLVAIFMFLNSSVLSCMDQDTKSIDKDLLYKHFLAIYEIKKTVCDLNTRLFISEKDRLEFLHEAPERCPGSYVSDKGIFYEFFHLADLDAYPVGDFLTESMTKNNLITPWGKVNLRYFSSAKRRQFLDRFGAQLVSKDTIAVEYSKEIYQINAVGDELLPLPYGTILAWIDEDDYNAREQLWKKFLADMKD
jgi:hypothetical protein